MPNSYHDVNYASPSTTLAFTNNDLKYLELAHMKIVVSNTTSGESVTFLQTDSTTFTVSANAGTTTINYAACVSSFPTGADKIRVQRVTPADNLLTTFTNSSLLRAEDLNENADQLLYVLQEQIDQGTGSLPLLPTGQYDAGSRQIINVADATDAQHATTFGQVSALVGNGTNSPSVAQNWEFTLGTTGSGGTYDGIANTSYILTPAPASSINATFIVEVAGVIQRPDNDFEINGNVLRVLNQNLTTSTFNGDSIVIQNFGLARTVYNFPVTGEAVDASEIPLTLKGSSGGDATPMLKVKDSADNDNATISAGGAIKAKSIDPIASGTLAVNPTTLTTSGAIVSNGNLTVGSGFSVTETTGDTTVNKLVISSTDAVNFDDTMAVPKSYVDSSGGFVGESINVSQSLNSFMTPGLYRGTAPVTNTTAFGFPSIPGNTRYALTVKRAGAANSNTIHQELMFYASSQQELRYERFHNTDSQSGSSSDNWGAWKKVINSENRLSDLSTSNGNYSMGTHKLTNHATPTADTDVAIKSYVDAEIVTFSETSGQKKLLATHTFDSNDFFFDASSSETWHTKYTKLEIFYDVLTTGFGFGIGLVRRNSAGIFSNAQNGDKEVSLMKPQFDNGFGETLAVASASQQQNSSGSAENTYDTDGYVVFTPANSGSGNNRCVGHAAINLEENTILFDMTASSRRGTTQRMSNLTYALETAVDTPISRLSFAAHTFHVQNNRTAVFSGTVKIYGTFR